MVPIQLKLERFSQDVSDYFFDMVEPPRPGVTPRERNALADRVLQETNNKKWSQLIRSGTGSDAWNVSAGIGNLAIKRMELYSLWNAVQDFAKTFSPPYTEKKAKEDTQRVIQETQKIGVTLSKVIKSAVGRILQWNGPPLFLTPRSDDFFEKTTTFDLVVGRRDAGFTIFTDGKGSPKGFGDVLDSTDTDFFFSPMEVEDYFNLLKELERPGSSKKGKDIVLWTARPMSDRDMYLKKGELPTGVYLSSNRSRVEGIARELGRGEVRDIWRVVVNEAMLQKTLDTSRIQDYQTIRPIRPKKMTLVMEGELTKYGSEGEYQGRTVTLDKPTKGDSKKYKVYVKNEKGNVVKVEFGDPDMEIKRDDPQRRKNFRSRHKCDEDPPKKWEPRYWSCEFWEEGKSVSELMGKKSREK